MTERTRTVTWKDPKAAAQGKLYATASTTCLAFDVPPG